MYFGDGDKEPAGLVKTAASQKSAARVNSIAGLMHKREFVGSFSVKGANYSFVYAPRSAAVEGAELKLTGKLTITGPGGKGRTRDMVHALLVAHQGGIGTAPPRTQIPGVASSPAQPAAPEGRPVTDSTGPLAFSGVLYFKLDPLDGGAFGVPADLSRVQFNARFAPASDDERELQFLYSELAAELLHTHPNIRDAEAVNRELNQRLGG